MAVITVRNVPDEVYRALRVRAALNGRSAEAEVRAVFADAVLPEGRAALGTLLTTVGRRAGLTDEELAGFTQRDTRAPPGAEAVTRCATASPMPE